MSNIQIVVIPHTLTKCLLYQDDKINVKYWIYQEKWRTHFYKFMQCEEGIGIESENKLHDHKFSNIENLKISLF